MLESGEFATIAELAEREGIAPSYMTRVLRLTLLAPDIVEAIMDGKQDPEVTLARMMKQLAAGVEWTAAAFRPEIGSVLNPASATRPRSDQPPECLCRRSILRQTAQGQIFIEGNGLVGAGIEFCRRGHPFDLRGSCSPCQPAGANECTLPPMQIAERPGLGGPPTELAIGLIVGDLLNVDDVNQQMTADLFATLEWSDPRLDGLDGCSFQRAGVWTPPITVFNSAVLTMERTQARDQVASGAAAG